MSTTHAIPSSQSLHGLRLVVTAIDLEQSEHRGIAVYSKGVLRALKRAGAEVWLLTQFDPPMNDLRSRRIPKTTADTVFYARVLEGLNTGHRHLAQMSLRQRVLRALPIVNQWVPPVLRARSKLNTLFPQRRYPSRSLKCLPIRELFDNPYLQTERLDYLLNVDGLICADDIFVNSFRLANQKPGEMLEIDLQGFDGLITTCPLQIRPTNPTVFIQTVHDLIPLEYVQTSDHVPGFARRLRSCAPAGRLFVSSATQRKFNASILPTAMEGAEHHSKVLIQSPSLQFPGDALDWEAQMPSLKINAEGKERLQTLQPGGYLLFNSSVEPRKNLLFALRAYVESGIERHGIRFCITGMLKKDAYSAAVSRLVSGHKSILLTGYVDEATKRHLYLNALALVSPSLVEGFGIPVLDAACLGLTAIASPSASHQEIQALHDFDQHVLLCSTLQTSDWASAMRLVTLKQEQEQTDLGPQALRRQLTRLRSERILRYRRYQQLIDQSFDTTICELVQAESGTATLSHPSRTRQMAPRAAT